MSTTTRLSAGQTRTTLPTRRAPSWQPATARRPQWETSSKVWNGETPPDIPPRPTGSRLRQRRWDQLFGKRQEQTS